MKKKILWTGGILVAVLLVVFIGLSIAVKNYLKSDTLKALIIPKVEEFTGRKAGVDRIDVSLFRGIAVKGIRLMEQDGKQEFVNVGEFVLEYRLFPLLKKRLVIKRIDLVSPSVRLVREKNGRFNFADITERSKEAQKQPTPGAAEEKGLPLSVENGQNIGSGCEGDLHRCRGRLACDNLRLRHRSEADCRERSGQPRGIGQSRGERADDEE